MKSMRSLAILFYSVAVLINFAEGIMNIQSNGKGGFCFRQIPKNSTAGECSKDDFCNTVSTHVYCGNSEECVVQERPGNGICKEACENSSCGKLCLQEYESKVAQYCIKSRDHPNALPPNVTESKKFFCVCTDPVFKKFHSSLSI